MQSTPNAFGVNNSTSTKKKLENMRTPLLRKSTGRSPWRRAPLFIPLALCHFALSPDLHAVTPAPDGAYPGGNTAEGQTALQSLTSGTNNTALGFQALYHNTTGGNNAATGFRALYINASGVNNTATGSQALFSNTTGSQNTANGYVALSSNTSGGSNTATGYGALHSNTSANHNTATGYIALYSNTTGSQNTATGDRALRSNTTGFGNTANGYQALYSDTTGILNTADGYQSLYSNTTGGDNTANGNQALYNNTTGGDNTANGIVALFNNTAGVQNTATGVQALYHNTTGNQNTAFGFGAGNGVTTAGNVICIGATGANLSNSCFIGNIRQVTTANADAIPVLIDSASQLGTASSSRRFKKEIKPMEQTSEAILALKPVTFQYKSDTKGTPQFGLIAEEVAEVNPDLVVRDADGEIYTVRYEAVNAMLLNEFLKEHRKVEEQARTVQEQKAAITQLKSTVAKQEATAALQQREIQAVTASLKEQAALIQKVSAQQALRRPAPQTAFNNQRAQQSNHP
jgi:hypothetical protein